MSDIKIRDTGSINFTDNGDVIEAGIVGVDAATAGEVATADGNGGVTWNEPTVDWVGNATDMAIAIASDSVGINTITDAVLSRMQNDTAFTQAFSAAIPTTITKVT